MTGEIIHTDCQGRNPQPHKPLETFDKEAQEKTVFQKYDKYLVLKQEDIEKFLPKHWVGHFITIIELIAKARREEGKKANTYAVVNEDESYAEDVWMLIKQGKSLKELGYRKLPKGKPPLLSPFGLAKLKRSEWTDGRWYYNPYEVAQAQWDLWNEWYEGRIER